MTLAHRDIEMKDDQVQQVWDDSIHTGPNEQVAPWMGALSAPILEAVYLDLQTLPEWRGLSPATHTAIAKACGDMVVRCMALGIAAERFGWPIKVAKL